LREAEWTAVVMTLFIKCSQQSSLAYNNNVKFWNFVANSSILNSDMIVDLICVVNDPLLITVIFSHCWFINFCRVFMLLLLLCNTFRLFFSLHICFVVFNTAFRWNVSETDIFILTCLTTFVCFFSDNSFRNHKHTV